MKRLSILLIISLAFCSHINAETMTLATSSADYQVVNVFSDVDFFNISIEIDAPLAAGAYNNPPIINVTYQVTGNLAAGTPSGFPAFDLQRSISGADFYAQGSSLNFEIAAFADLSDGVQTDELVDTGSILSFNGREINNGRFHPALFELNFGGVGRIQNSNNIVTQDPFVEVAFGEEYINDLSFDPGSTTLIHKTLKRPLIYKRGGGAPSPLTLMLLLFFVAAIKRRRG